MIGASRGLGVNYGSVDQGNGPNNWRCEAHRSVSNLALYANESINIISTIMDWIIALWFLHQDVMNWMEVQLGHLDIHASTLRMMIGHLARLDHVTLSLSSWCRALADKQSWIYTNDQPIMKIMNLCNRLTYFAYLINNDDTSKKYLCHLGALRETRVGWLWPYSYEAQRHPIV